MARYDACLSIQNAVAFRPTTKVGNQTLPVYLDVGSVGGTVQYFATFNVLGDDPGTGSTAVEHQQLVKLGAATP
ncbi:hypothetical protein ACF1GW_05035 [Streptomyces achromogenes]|uniref:hypothetical protein n=1 Tax=Streptomyces achromogenes TaxID=67255 RepID=UPI0036FCA314